MNATGTRSSVLLTTLIVAGVVLALAGGAMVLWRARGSRFTREGEANPPRSLVIIVSGDTSGWITPCGCTSNQSGGLPRRASYLDEVRRGADMIYADAGGAPAGASEYQHLKFEAILRGEMAMGLAAHNIGGPEAALGPTYLRGISERITVPFVSANLADSSGKPVAPPLRIVTSSGRRIALAGVLSPRYATRDAIVNPPREAILAALPAYRGQYDALIILAYLPEDELQEFTAGLPEADAVVGGPTGQTLPPRRVGPALLTSATNKGKFLARLELPAVPNSVWSASIVELDTKWPDHAAQVRNVSQYLESLSKRDFAAAETGLAPAAVAGQPANYHVAGSQACSVCHADTHKTWSAGPHAQAWQVLEAKKSQADPSCQVCHTTGYGLPGGFASIAASRELLAAVGCEDCHGPASAHAWQPQHHTLYAARDQCSRCHDRENSPAFDFKTYWERIAHGREKITPAGPAVLRRTAPEDRS